MQDNVGKEIAALKQMTVNDLRRRHIELFGEPTRSGNRQWLFRRLAWRVQAMAEGGLSERARERAVALARETDLRLRPPAGMDMDASSRQPAITKPFKVPRDCRLPRINEPLRRIYKGHEYVVRVVPNGFEYDGGLYRSLSAVAHVITGSHWNGYLFFNIEKPE